MMKIDLHTHTIASGHAFNTIYEMAETAGKKGVKILGIGEHGPQCDGSASEVYFNCLDRAPKSLFGVKILYGVELNIINQSGEVDLSELVLKKLDFASGFHIASSYQDSPETYTAAVINAMKNPHVSIIVHSYWTPPNTNIEKIAQATCDNNKLMEISLVHFDHYKMTHGEALARLKKMIAVVKNNGFKILLGSDAHAAAEIGEDAVFRKEMKSLGLADKDIANNDVKYLRKFIKNI